MRARPPGVCNRSYGTSFTAWLESQQAATADKAHSNAQGREWDRNSNM